MILTGIARIGRDAEIRFTTNGDAVANVSLAWNYGKKDADGNQKTQWAEADLWGKRAEALQQYLTKGSLISIVAEEPHIEEYQKKDGTTGTKLTARIVSLEFAGGKRSESDSGHQQAPQRSNTAQAPKPKPKQANDFPDDDIPF